jgi:proteasome accessory factor C
MTDVAAAQLRRILAIIPELADDRPHSVAEIAERLGMSRDTLGRDLRLISERYDDPGGFIDSVRIYVGRDDVSIQANHFHRPMRLTVAEVGALDLGLALLRAERTQDERAPIERARERLRTVLARLPDDPPPLFDHRLVSDGGSEADRETLTQVTRAMRRSRKVRISYRGSTDTESSARVVCPYASAFATGAWYLVAHCDRSRAIRVFRVDRIEAVEALDEAYQVPADFSMDEIVKDGRVFQGDAPERVQIRYGPAVARWIAEREGHDLAPDGSLTLEYPMADQDWVVRHVLQYGADAEVIGPAGARAAVRAALEGICGPRG